MKKKMANMLKTTKVVKRGMRQHASKTIDCFCEHVNNSLMGHYLNIFPCLVWFILLLFLIIFQKIKKYHYIENREKLF